MAAKQQHDDGHGSPHYERHVEEVDVLDEFAPAEYHREHGEIHNRQAQSQIDGEHHIVMPTLLRAHAGLAVVCVFHVSLLRDAVPESASLACKPPYLPNASGNTCPIGRA
ncbi:hypothetical protein [Phenylobacterium sp. SCN 70-31]|uniref:hypothetical protein n=1 Tax=Phenylobacterium sp. SCN 70-31 TaxID=1660129 RepID=UPI003441C070